MIASTVNSLEKLKDRMTGKQENEFDQYGKYIATQLKTLPVPEALLLMTDIQRQITEKRLAFTGTEVYYVQHNDNTDASQ